MNRDFDILWLDEIDSTNNELKRQISTIDNMSVIAARNQYAGRGQRGNKWNAAPGENLTFSIIIRPGKDGIQKIEAKEQFLLSQITTLSVYSALTDFGIEAKIKWPNDIYVRNKKICGILIENFIEGNSVAASIIGIGLNVNQRIFDPQLMNPTSMSLLKNTKFELNECLSSILKHFSGFLYNTSSVSAEYIEKMYRRNEYHKFVDCIDNVEFTGKITGISPVGFLTVEMPDKTERQFGFKEIAYIL